ncbi:MAG: class I SAM-dependent rRNA methyltransferase [Nitrospirae bacterium]|nr:class I SAM-dependent rRNA methyltransferase [Nitrospirota bacterium]
MMQKVHLTRTKRLLGGHLWVFSNELHESPKNYTPGSLVEVYDMRGDFLGTGYINPNSLIAVRLLTRERKNIDKDFLRVRIQAAIALRKRLTVGSDACRLVFSEGDYLPGLIADLYGTCLVLQFLTCGMEAMKDLVIELFDELIKPEIIVLRNEGRVRSLEGLDRYKEVVKGSLESLPVVREDDISFEIDPYEGQKTGFFLDQRDNRVSLKRYIREGKGLDLFCYNGGWSMHLASAGAEITCVDSSDRAIAHARRNAELNNLGSRIDYAVEDVFAYLEKELGKGERRYDFIVLDPPAFVKSAGKLKEAAKAYREVNEICMRLIRPGGMLASSSCSYHMGRELFVDTLNTAAKNARRSLRLIELRSQAPDHPVLLSMPETAYLKCAFLLVD